MVGRMSLNENEEYAGRIAKYGFMTDSIRYESAIVVVVLVNVVVVVNVVESRMKFLRI